MYVEWRRKLRAGLTQLQHSYVPLFKSTRIFRVYSPTIVPGLLQTEGYASGLLSTVTDFRGIPNEVGEAVAARLDRSRILHEQGRRFLFVISEAVLRHQVADAEAMAAQLGYLLAAGALPAVSLGIVPMASPPGDMWPVEAFHMYDDTLVSVELLSARVTVTQPADIEVYARAFERLRQMAVYGAEARSLIVQAIDEL